MQVRTRDNVNPACTAHMHHYCSYFPHLLPVRPHSHGCNAATLASIIGFFGDVSNVRGPGLAAVTRPSEWGLSIAPLVKIDKTGKYLVADFSCYWCGNDSSHLTDSLHWLWSKILLNLTQNIKTPPPLQRRLVTVSVFTIAVNVALNER